MGSVLKLRSSKQRPSIADPSPTARVRSRARGLRVNRVLGVGFRASGLGSRGLGCQNAVEIVAKP